MDKDARIFVAGARGMVGSALVKALRSQKYQHLLTPGREQLDLCDQRAVADFFAENRPDYVFLAAARVGGIQANSSYPAEFIFDNLQIQSNVIHQAYVHGVKRLLFLGSSCIYPKLAPQPLREEALLTGPLEPTNEPYAIAKIAGLKMCEAYNRQHGTSFFAVMPTNLYGPGDNFDLQSSHVLPALLRKCHEAKISGAKCLSVWGSGTPRREFLHVDDMAAGCLFMMQQDDEILARELLSYPNPCFVNLGIGADVTIRELAQVIMEVVGFEGELVFDVSKPDGTLRKLLDISRATRLGWHAKIGLNEGVELTYRWFMQRGDS
ncbi:MAG: GDP-L-fucose synthase [Desulfuromonadales bacterium]|nr:GDP-L-fucose synthase [Desulfuromonadales bacterium]